MRSSVKIVIVLFSEKIDLVIAFGGDVSRAEFKAQKTVMKTFLDGFSVARDKTSVALLRYGQDARTYHNFGQTRTQSTVKQVIDRIPFVNPGNRIDKALQEANGMIWNERKGMREMSDKFMIIFVTSLKDSDVLNLKPQVKALQDKGVRIIMISYRNNVVPSAMKELLGESTRGTFVSDSSKLKVIELQEEIIHRIKQGKRSNLKIYRLREAF